MADKGALQRQESWLGWWSSIPRLICDRHIIFWNSYSRFHQQRLLLRAEPTRLHSLHGLPCKNLLQMNCCIICCAYPASQSVSSVDQSCLSLCNLMDYSRPGFPVHHQLLELAQIHVNRVDDAIQPSHPVIPFSSFLQSFPESASFPMSQFFKSDSQVLDLQLQHWSFLNRNWFPLVLTGWISWQSKRLSRVFSNTTFQKHQFFSAQLSL